MRHLRIDGYPATVVTIESLGGGKYTRETTLLVYAPNHGPLYQVSTLAEEAYFDEIDREMQAIIASFHIEKVAVPTSGKWGRTGEGRNRL